MKKVIYYINQATLQAGFLKLSEAHLLSKICQNSPEHPFTVRLLRVSKTFYNNTFKY
jgi:hypothetical protein